MVVLWRTIVMLLTLDLPHALLLVEDEIAAQIWVPTSKLLLKLLEQVI